MTDLSWHIESTLLCDTHEHMWKEALYLKEKPDILQCLFDNYAQADLRSAGLPEDGLAAMMDCSNDDVHGRFDIAYKYWQAAQHTGYCEAVRLTAKNVYQVDELTPDSVAGAATKHAELIQPGQRLHLLRDVARLDHVQTDDGCWPCLPDESGRDFFFYDLSWWSFCNGTPELQLLAEETGIEVIDLKALGAAMDRLFEKYGPVAVAVKSQHAYHRTLAWQERTDADAERALSVYLKDPKHVDEATRLCLGDWCWARGAEMCAAYDLPFKVHTGYIAGNNRMSSLDSVRAGHMCGLLKKYSDTRWVLMHIAYPYHDELTAIAKHYPSVYIDMCWAWSINPYAAAEFLRHYIHAVPANKLFVFGGDTRRPMGAVGYAMQARAGLNRALQAEIDDDLLTERQAINYATAVMCLNQHDCFQIDAKREAVKK